MEAPATATPKHCTSLGARAFKKAGHSRGKKISGNTSREKTSSKPKLKKKKSGVHGQGQPAACLNSFMSLDFVIKQQKQMMEKKQSSHHLTSLSSIFSKEDVKQSIQGKLDAPSKVPREGFFPRPEHVEERSEATLSMKDGWLEKSPVTALPSIGTSPEEPPQDSSFIFLEEGQQDDVTLHQENPQEEEPALSQAQTTLGTAGETFFIGPDSQSEMGSSSPQKPTLLSAFSKLHFPKEQGNPLPQSFLGRLRGEASQGEDSDSREELHPYGPRGFLPDTGSHTSFKDSTQALGAQNGSKNKGQKSLEAFSLSDLRQPIPFPGKIDESNKKKGVEFKNLLKQLSIENRYEAKKSGPSQNNSPKVKNQKNLFNTSQGCFLEAQKRNSKPEKLSSNYFVSQVEQKTSQHSPKLKKLDLQTIRSKETFLKSPAVSSRKNKADLSKGFPTPRAKQPSKCKKKGSKKNPIDFPLSQSPEHSESFLQDLNEPIPKQELQIRCETETNGSQGNKKKNQEVITMNIPTASEPRKLVTLESFTDVLKELS